MAGDALGCVLSQLVGTFDKDWKLLIGAAAPPETDARDLASWGRKKNSMAREKQRARLTSGRYELRRATLDQYWCREDPPVQLPPGATIEETYRFQIGLSVEQARELTTGLSLTGGKSTPLASVQLGYTFTERFGVTVAVTTQSERTKRVTLANPTVDQYRRFAVWHVVTRITVHALRASSYPVPQDGPFSGRAIMVPKWLPRGEVEFLPSDAVTLTWVDVEPTRVQ
jgi:hypothetical protein